MPKVQVETKASKPLTETEYKQMQAVRVAVERAKVADRSEYAYLFGRLHDVHTAIFFKLSEGR